MKPRQGVCANGLLPFQPHRLARRKDPETSHQAANAAKGLRAAHSERILELLRSGHVLAAEQLADGLALSPVQVNRRLAELEDSGLIERTDQRHRNRSGRMAVRWRAAE